jgi:hypothetical protein
MEVVLLNRNVVNVYWSLYCSVFKNQQCGGSLAEGKIARYQITNYSIIIYTSIVEALREKCHELATSKLAYSFDV